MATPTCSASTYDAAINKCVSCSSGTLTNPTLSTVYCSVGVVRISDGRWRLHRRFGQGQRALRAPVREVQQRHSHRPDNQRAVLRGNPTENSPTQSCAAGSYDTALSMCVSCTTGTLTGQTTASPYCAITPTQTSLSNTNCPSATYGQRDGRAEPVRGLPGGSTLKGGTTSAPYCQMTTGPTLAQPTSATLRRVRLLRQRAGQVRVVPGRLGDRSDDQQPRLPVGERHDGNGVHRRLASQQQMRHVHLGHLCRAGLRCYRQRGLRLLHAGPATELRKRRH